MTLLTEIYVDYHLNGTGDKKKYPRWLREGGREMSRKRYKPEKIIAMLRQPEVELRQGKRLAKSVGRCGSRSRVTIAGGARRWTEA